MINGVQVSSLKPLLMTASQVQEAFSRLKALGCKTVQLQWIDPSVPAEEIAKALQENGITSVSIQDFYDLVLENLTYYTHLNAATGGTWHRRWHLWGKSSVFIPFPVTFRLFPASTLWNI